MVRLVVSILYWRCGSCLKRLSSNTAVSSVFQFSIGDAQPASARLRRSVSRIVSILYWRCIESSFSRSSVDSSTYVSILYWRCFPVSRQQAWLDVKVSILYWRCLERCARGWRRSSNCVSILYWRCGTTLYPTDISSSCGSLFQFSIGDALRRYIVLNGISDRLFRFNSLLEMHERGRRAPCRRQGGGFQFSIGDAVHINQRR